MRKRLVGRYFVFEAFARGGMASVHLGRLIADRGFSRLVAVKMLMRGQVSSVYARALEEEARIASRIRHPNVVQPLDFVVEGDDILVVMEYVHGAALSQLIKASGSSPMPAEVTAAILCDILNGLHAAHEATDEIGRPLGVVHRDVSPHNILVGADGVARLADFGIAKVMRSSEQTQTGIVKGKLAYMAPEQLRGLPLTRQADIYSAGAVLAESLSGVSPDPNDKNPSKWLPRAIALIHDTAILEVVRIATKSDARDRFGTASEMSAALASALVPARVDQVADRVTVLASDILDLRSEMVRAVESLRIEEDELPVKRESGRPPRQEERDLAGQVHLSPAVLSASNLITDSAPTAAPRPISAPPPSIRLDASTSQPPLVGNTLEPAQTTSRRSVFPLPTDSQRWFYAFAAVAISLLVIGLWLRFGKDSPAEVASEPAPAATPTEPPPAVEPAAAPSTEPALAPTASIAASEPTPVTSATKVTTKAGGKRVKVGTSRPRRPDCNPPFRIDAEGKKHYKPECD